MNHFELKEHKLKSQFGLFLTLMFFIGLYFSGCQQPAAASVIPKTDTGIISYWPTKRVNPQMYIAIWHVSAKYKPSPKDSTKNTLSSDTSYSVKLSDTTADGKGGQIRDLQNHSIAYWYNVPDSLNTYVHIIPKPKN